MPKFDFNHPRSLSSCEFYIDSSFYLVLDYIQTTPHIQMKMIHLILPNIYLPNIFAFSNVILSPRIQSSDKIQDIGKIYNFKYSGTLVNEKF